jgi:hypothetical protein
LRTTGWLSSTSTGFSMGSATTRSSVTFVAVTVTLVDGIGVRSEVVAATVVADSRRTKSFMIILVVG